MNRGRRRGGVGRGTYETVFLHARLLDPFRLLDRILPDDLHPVAVGIQGEGDAPHAAVRQFLLELIPSVFEPLAGRLDVVDADANVSEALARIAVAVGNFEGGVVLRAVVVRQLEDAFAVGPVVACGGGLGRVIGEEVQVEFVVRKGELVDLFEAEELVVFDCGLGRQSLLPKGGDGKVEDLMLWGP